MFGLFGNGGGAPAKPSAAPSTPPSPPAAPFTQTPPLPGQPKMQHQQQQPAPAAPAAPQVINLADLLAQGSSESTNPSDYAAQFLSALSAIPDPSLDQSGQPVQVNVNELFTAASGIDMTQGIDMAALIEGLQGENGAQLLQHAFQQAQVNTIMMLAPLMNQLVQASAERTADTAITGASHNMLANAVISEFSNRFEYSKQPIVSQMLQGLAEQLSKSAPRGTPVSTIVNALDMMFRGFASSTTSPSRPQNVPQSAQVDFQDLFK